MKKSDFCKRCAIHLGKSQFNKFACTDCKRLRGKYYPSAFIKARKPEQASYQNVYDTSKFNKTMEEK